MGGKKILITPLMINCSHQAKDFDHAIDQLLSTHRIYCFEKHTPTQKERKTHTRRFVGPTWGKYDSWRRLKNLEVTHLCVKSHVVRSLYVNSWSVSKQITLDLFIQSIRISVNSIGTMIYCGLQKVFLIDHKVGLTCNSHHIILWDTCHRCPESRAHYGSIWMDPKEGPLITPIQYQNIGPKRLYIY